MIVYPVVDDQAKVNRIHLMLGPESDEFLMLFGHQALSLDEIKKHVFKNNYPTHLLITKVVSEMAAGMMVQKFMIQNHMQNEMFEHKGKAKTTHDLEHGVWVQDLICPKCSNKGVFLKKNEMALCKDCLKIEKGLSKPIEVSKKKTVTKEPEENENKDTPGVA